jgi:hypothetical protein
MVDAWKHTSNLLLAHFHFVCNGSAPLRVDWNDRASATFAQLDEDQVNFMKKTQELASREGMSATSCIRGREIPLSFISHVHR